MCIRNLGTHLQRLQMKKPQFPEEREETRMQKSDRKQCHAQDGSGGENARIN
jgi:hypothetical protein